MQSREINNTEVKATPDLAKEKKQLTVTFFVGGQQVESLTDLQKGKMASRLSKTMSNYYSLHTSEYGKIRS